MAHENRVRIFLASLLYHKFCLSATFFAIFFSCFFAFYENFTKPAKTVYEKAAPSFKRCGRPLIVWFSFSRTILNFQPK